MASTLPAIPSFNKNVPVVTSNGGTLEAYNDPKSPESILRKTAELNAQSKVDSKYDVAASPYHDGFIDMPASSRKFAIQTILTIIILVFIFLVTMQKKIPVWLNLCTLSLAVGLMILVIMMSTLR